jgi:hypothetical protein
MLPITEIGVYRVINADQLQTYTESGWKLVAVLENEAPSPFTEQVPLQNLSVPSIFPGGNQPHITATKWLSTKSSTFLVIMDEQTTLAKMQAELKVAQEQLSKEVRDFDAFKALIANDAKKYDEMKRDHHTISGALLQLDKEFLEYKAKAEAELKAGEEKLKEAASTIQKYMRKTAYERILEGEFDERIESVEAGDFGYGRKPVADVPQEPGVHPKSVGDV